MFSFLNGSWVQCGLVADSCQKVQNYEKNVLLSKLPSNVLQKPNTILCICEVGLNWFIHMNKKPTSTCTTTTVSFF